MTPRRSVKFIFWRIAFSRIAQMFSLFPVIAGNAVSVGEIARPMIRQAEDFTTLCVFHGYIFLVYAGAQMGAHLGSREGRKCPWLYSPLYILPPLVDVADPWIAPSVVSISLACDAHLAAEGKSHADLLQEPTRAGGAIRGSASRIPLPYCLDPVGYFICPMMGMRPVLVWFPSLRRLLDSEIGFLAQKRVFPDCCSARVASRVSTSMNGA